MKLINKYSFTGGQQQDKMPNLLEAGEYLQLQNGRVGVSQTGRNMRIENILGTELQVQAVHPPYGTNYVIGSCIDEANNRLIYFLFNSAGDHGIYCYDYSDGITYAILYDSQVSGGLGFTSGNLSEVGRINRNAFVVDNLLYWTDGANQPRRINIEAGIKMNLASYATDVTPYSWPMNQSVITLIRKPPNYLLSVEKVASGSVGITVNNNQVKDFAGWFAWFYTYRDGETSTTSQRSVLVPFNTEAETYDVVRVRASLSETIDQDVQKVTIAVIYATDNKGYEVKTWDKANATDLAEINAHNAGSTQLTFLFTNSEVGNALSSRQLDTPYDSVPLTSYTLENAGRRLHLGYNLMGYDSPKTTSLTAATITSSVATTLLKTGSSRRVAIVFYDKYMRACGVVPYSKLITVADRGFTFSATYDYAIRWTLSNTSAVAEIPDWAYYYSIVTTKDITRASFMQAFAGDIFYATKDNDGVYSYTKTTFSADNAGIAIRLNVLNGNGMGYTYAEGDRIRLSVLYGSTLTTATLAVVAVDGDYLIADNYDLGSINYLSLAFFELYTPNNQSAANFFYEQGNIYAVTNPTEGTRSYSTLTGDIAGDVYLMLRDILNKIGYNGTVGTVNDESCTLGVAFTYQLASSSKYTTGSSPFQNLVGFDAYTDNTRWILKTNADEVNLNIKGLLKVSGGSGVALNAEDFTVSLEWSNGSTAGYAALVETQTLVRNRIYSFNINVDVTIPANTRVFVIARMSGAYGSEYITVWDGSTFAITTMADGAQANFEAMSPNDRHWADWFTNAGRIQLIDSIGQQTINGARWSQTYLSDRANGLSSFDALDQKELSDEFGRLRKLQVTSKVNNELGVVMLAICENETASMYLGEVQTYGSNAPSTLATSAEVIGTVNRLNGSLGTQNPESVVEHNGLVFWLDMSKGAVVQYSSNGLEVVSDFGMRRFFQWYCQNYLELGAGLVYERAGFSHITFGVDPFTKELLVVLPKLIEDNGTVFPSYGGVTPSYASSIINQFDMYSGLSKTMSYSYEENLWKQTYEWVPEWLDNLRFQMIAFRSANLYLFNQDQGALNTIFGTQYPVRIWFAANVPPSVMKNLATISVQGNVAPDYAVAMVDYPDQQITDLTEDDFTDQEGEFYASFLRDRLSPNVSGSAVMKMNYGDQLKSEVILVMCEFRQYTALMYVNWINIGVETSKGQNDIIPK